VYSVYIIAHHIAMGSFMDLGNFVGFGGLLLFLLAGLIRCMMSHWK